MYQSIQRFTRNFSKFLGDDLCVCINLIGTQTHRGSTRAFFDDLMDFSAGALINTVDKQTINAVHAET